MRGTCEAGHTTSREPEHHDGIEDADIHTELKSVCSDYAQQSSLERFLLNPSSILEKIIRVYVGL